MIGAAATPQPTGNCARWGYHYNGNRAARPTIDGPNCCHGPPAGGL